MEIGLKNVQSVGLGDEMLYITTAPLPPVPWVPPARRVRFDEAGRCFSPTGSSPWQLPEPLQPDAYLRAAQIDSDDTSQMENFINRYGSPGVDPVLQHHDYPPRQLEKGLREEPFGLGHVDVLIKNEIETARRRRPFIEDETLASVSYGFRSIRTMTYTWLLLLGRPREELKKLSSVPESEVEAEIEAIAMDAGLRGLFVQHLARMLDDALSVFAPRVYHPILAEDNRTEEKLHPSAIEAHNRTHPPLFCVLALQLAHAMEEKWEVSTCDECRRLFNFQEGFRSQNQGTQHRDAMYCHKVCARRKTQRLWRRKKRANERSSQADETSAT